MQFPSWLEEYSPLIGRILMGAIFLMSGIDKALDFPGTVTALLLQQAPYPVALAIISIVAGVVFGCGLIVGYRTRVCAAVLLVFTASVAIFFHTADTYQSLITSDLAMISGLLYMMTYGSGPVSIEPKTIKRRA